MRSRSSPSFARRGDRLGASRLWRAVVAGWVLTGAALPGGGFRSGWALAEAYRPGSDEEVIERLPVDSRGAEARRRRQELASDPDNLRDSVELARSYLETAVMEGDVRMTGFAREVLAPWWDVASPPVPVLLLRARVRGLGCELDRALADVDLALAAEPQSVEAQRARCGYLLARGDIDAAREAFRGLAGRLGAVERALDAARIGRFGDGLTAAMEGIRSVLEPGVGSGGGNGAGVGPAGASVREAWVLWADLSRQAGRDDLAEIRLERVRAGGGTSVAAAAALADLHLERGAFRKVLPLVRGLEGVDVLALRALAALEGISDRTAEEEAQRVALGNQVPRRLEARRRRGDASVLADEAWYRLRVSREPGAAWERAWELWSVRREVGDARLVLAAGAAAGRRVEARPVVDWVRRHGYGDARMAGVFRELGVVP